MNAIQQNISLKLVHTRYCFWWNLLELYFEIITLILLIHYDCYKHLTNLLMII